MAFSIFFFVLAYPSAQAWELQDLTLKERLDRTAIVVVASVQEELSARVSDIAGVGVCSEAKLIVDRVLKGEAPDVITVSWCEVAEVEVRSSVMIGQHVWLLSEPAADGLYRLAGNFAAILPIEDLEQVASIIR